MSDKETGGSSVEDETSDGLTIFEGYPVKKDRYIRIPEEVQTAIQTETIKGPSVYWNYDKNSTWVVLSSTPIADDSYVNGEYTKIQEETEDYSRIRPHKSLGVQIMSKFAADNHLTYLARDSDIHRDNARVFLLTKNELAPHIEIDGLLDTDEMDGELLQNPGFLPSMK